MPKLTLYKLAVSDFQKNWFSSPKIKILNFQGKNPLKIIFVDIQKTDYAYYRVKCQQHVYKISSQYLYFGCAKAQKPSNGNNVTFLKLDFWNF